MLATGCWQPQYKGSEMMARVAVPSGDCKFEIGRLFGGAGG